MGMYTTLSGKVEITDNKFNGQNLYHILLQCIAAGGEAGEVAKEFIALPRYDSIQMEFDNWGDNLSNIMVVEADMKNYHGEVEVFLEKLLPIIACDWEIEVDHEEWLASITATKEGGYDPSQAKYWDDEQHY